MDHLFLFKLSQPLWRGLTFVFRVITATLWQQQPVQEEVLRFAEDISQLRRLNLTSHFKGQGLQHRCDRHPGNLRVDRTEQPLANARLQQPFDPGIEDAA